MEPARSFAMTRSHASTFEPGFIASRVSSVSFAVRSFWLWHVTQSLSRIARAGAGPTAGAFCGAAVWAPFSRRTAQTASISEKMDSLRIHVLLNYAAMGLSDTFSLMYQIQVKELRKGL